MLLRIFRGNQPATLFVVILTAILVYVSIFFNLDTYAPQKVLSAAPFHLILESILGDLPVLDILLSLVLTVLLGLTVNALNNKYYFINERSFLPVLFILLIPAPFKDLLAAWPVIISAFFLVFALDRLFRSYGLNSVSFHFFEAAMLISFGSLFYFPLLVFGLIVWVAVITLRTFRWREWLTPVFGLATPYAFLFGIHYLLHGDVQNLLTRFSDLLQSEKIHHLTTFQWIWLGLLSLVILIASSHTIRHYGTMKVSSSRYFTILFWTFLVAVISFLFVPGVSLEFVFLMAVPVSYLYTYYFLFVKPVYLGNIFFSLLFLGMIVLRVLGGIT